MNANLNTPESKKQPEQQSQARSPLLVDPRRLATPMLCLLVVVAFIALLALALGWNRPVPFPTVGEYRSAFVTEMLDEVSRIRSEIAQRPAVRDQGDSQAERLAWEERLTTLEMRVKTFAGVPAREEYLLDVATNSASQAASSASGMVEYLAILFSLVLFGVALLMGFQVHHLGQELLDYRARMREDVDTFRKEIEAKFESTKQALEEHSTRVMGALTESRRLAQEELVGERDQISTLLGTARAEVSSLQASFRKEQEQARQVLPTYAEILTAALADLAHALPADAQDHKEQRHALLVKTREHRAKLLLLHWNSSQQEVGVRELGAIGRRSAIGALERLRVLESTSGGLKDEINRAIARIDERHPIAARSSAQGDEHADQA